MVVTAVIFFEFFLLFCTSEFCNCDENYSRSKLLAKYPENEKNFVFMPDPHKNGKYVVCYFNTSDSVGDEYFRMGEDVENKVSFSLYNRDYPKGVLIKSRKDLQEYKFNSSKEIKGVTHGWMSSGTADTCITIKDAYLKNYDVNVFILDWSEIANNIFYNLPMGSTPHVAEYYGQFLNYLIDDWGVNPKNIHLIGHSLGAHISGFAARRSKKLIGRVTGLDPARPGYDNFLFVEGDRLSNEDAEFVDVIHTCKGFLGLETPIGHADFYPNGGGPPQPGCTLLKIIEACSHGASWKHYALSISQDRYYWARGCNSYEDYLRLKGCKDIIPMGEPVPKTARGMYFLKTEENGPLPYDVSL